MRWSGWERLEEDDDEFVHRVSSSPIFGRRRRELIALWCLSPPLPSPCLRPSDGLTAAERRWPKPSYPASFIIRCRIAILRGHVLPRWPRGRVSFKKASPFPSQFPRSSSLITSECIAGADPLADLLVTGRDCWFIINQTPGKFWGKPEGVSE